CSAVAAVNATAAQCGCHNVWLLADAESREDARQQVLAGELPGDLAQGLLRAAQLLGHELAGARLGQLPLSLAHMRPRALQGLEVPAACTHRAALDDLVAHAVLQVRAQRVEPRARERR